MKAINKIIILGMVTTLFSSCDLTLLPENAVTPENYFQNKSDLELWTNQFYTLLDEPDASAGTNADDMIDKGMGQVIEGTRSAASETGWSWTKLRHINYFLQHSSNCDDETARNQYNGVVQFFRAYFYFVKVRRYGDVPWYDQVLGSEDQELLVKARDSREFVMNQVLKDFQDAATSLPTKSTETRNTRVTKWAALAFASQAALYEGTYRKYHELDNYEKYLEIAASTARQFIDESGFSLYKEGTEPYRDMFCADNAKTTEVVLARAYNFEGLQLSHSVQFSIANLQMGFTRRFMNHYLMTDGTRFTDKQGYETMFYTEEVKIGTLGTEEIDFVCKRNGEILYVQVSLELSKEETIEREFGNLLKIKDNYPKVVVSGEKMFENTYEGIEHIYIRDFLSSVLLHSITRVI